MSVQNNPTITIGMLSLIVIAFTQIISLVQENHKTKTEDSYAIEYLDGEQDGFEDGFEDGLHAVSVQTDGVKVERVHDPRPEFDGIMVSDSEGGFFVEMTQLRKALKEKGKCGLCGK